MAPHQDDLAIGLQEAIKTTLVQLCKVGIIYQFELAIAGTVGVTVDRKRTILVHFDERLDPCQPDTSSMVVAPPRSDLAEVNVMVNSSALGAVGGAALGLLPLTSSPPQSSALSVAFTDLAQFTSPSTSNRKNEAYSQTLPVSIDIDSDSDSLCELGFDDDVIEVDPSTMIRKKEVMWSGEDDYFDPKKDSKVLVKSIEIERMEMDSVVSVPSHSTQDDTEPSSSALVADDPTVQSLMNPPRLLIDKRLFLKKMSPEAKKSHATRLSAVKAAAAAAAAATLTAPQATSSNDVAEGLHLPRGKDQDSSSKPRLICEVCGKGVLTHGLMEAHLVEAHDVVYSASMGEIAHFTCKHCTKKFRYRATLDKHEFLHVADKPYKCHICKNTYCYEESLQIHMNVHAGVLDCLICQKMYSSRKHLQKHIVYMHEMRRVRNGTTKKPRLLSMDDQE